MKRVLEIEQILKLWKHQEESFVQLSRRLMSQMKGMIRKHSKSKGGFSKKSKKGKNGGGKRGTRKHVKVPNQIFWMVFLMFWGHLVQSHIIAKRYEGRVDAVNTVRTKPFRVHQILTLMLRFHSKYRK